MTKPEELYHQIADQIPETSKGKMFGAQCIKAHNGKAGVMFWKEFMIFKLEGDDLKYALSLDGAKNFDPMDGRPMKEWVQLSYDHKDKWPVLAEKAMDHVSKLKK